MVYYGLVDANFISLPLEDGMGPGAWKGMQRLQITIDQLETFHARALERMIEEGIDARGFNSILLEHALCKYHRYCKRDK